MENNGNMPHNDNGNDVFGNEYNTATDNVTANNTNNASNNTPANNANNGIAVTNNHLARFFLTFFLGWIGSIVINHSSLKPNGYKSRTLAYVFLSIVTLGIYGLVASICNLMFDPAKERNIGYFKE